VNRTIALPYPRRKSLVPSGRPTYSRLRIPEDSGLTKGLPPCSFDPPNAHMSVEIKIRKGETVDKALRRLKKKIDREGIIKDARAKRGFEKPAERRRRKKKVKNFSAYLRKKWDNA
jgi:small subunit ribosomal protein S21